MLRLLSKPLNVSTALDRCAGLKTIDAFQTLEPDNKQEEARMDNWVLKGTP